VRALITGIAGFAGRHLTEHLVARDDIEVYGAASPRRDARDIARLVDKDHLQQLDLTDLQAVLRLLEAARPDAIYHLAAQASISRAWEDPAKTLANNVTAQANLLQAVAALHLNPSILVVGSADEYGRVQPDDLPVDEDTPLRPVNPYAVSKVAQDYLGLQYHLSHGLRIVRVRPFNHIGPGQQLGFVVPDFCEQIARIEVGLQEPVITVGNLTARRDFTDVRDIVRGYHLALTQGLPGQVYNLGASRAYAIQEILDRLLAECTVAVRVEQDAARMRPSDIPTIVSDCRRIHQQVGWEPCIPLEQSLRDALDDWRRRVARTA
jgi:GDP-4-dehydro-6-deoxy-D-mannose reductase